MAWNAIRFWRLACAAAMAAGLVAPTHAQSDASVTLDAEYMVDIVTVADGADKGTRHVDLLSVTGELDLDAVARWNGARVVAQVIAGTGDEPNDLAGTLQGINNNAVSDNRVKIYQLYLAQEFADAPVTLRAGFIDLNEDFYANDAAGLLIAPAFGIGSELAATGPNGPAIFPSTSLTATMRVEPTDTSYAQLAVVNAEAGVIGDQGGVPGIFKHGALLIGEAGWSGWGKLAAGVWSYTDRQDDIRLTDAGGDPVMQRARGGYVLVEMPLMTQGGEPSDKAALFVRAGFSDGDTTPYSGGWQAGVLVNAPFAARPDGEFSLGANQAFLSDKFRLNEFDAGNPQRSAETGFEVTYADQLAPWLTVQGDAQYIRISSRAAGSRDAVVFGLRFTVAHSQAF